MLAPGYKYNLTDINAAIALVQLNKLEQLNSRRAQIAQQYQQALADTPFQPLDLPRWPHVHAWHLFIIRVDETRCGLSRDALMEALKTKDIGTGLHFRAAHTQNIIANASLPFRSQILNGTARASARCRYSQT